MIPSAVEDELAGRGPGGACPAAGGRVRPVAGERQRRNVLPQVPSQTTNSACFSSGVAAAWRRPGQPGVGHFQTHQRSSARRAASSRPRSCRPGPRAPRRARAIAAARARPRSRSCTGSSGRRSRSRTPSADDAGAPVAVGRVSAAATGSAEYRRGSERDGRAVRPAPGPALRFGYQTAGRPALRGSVAAATSRPRSAGRRRRARSRGRGRAGRRTARSGSTGWPSAARCLERRPGRKRGSARTSSGGAKCSSGSTNQRGVADRRRDVHARRRRAPTRPGRGSAAGRRRPSSRRRPTAAARRRKSIPGSSVWSVRLPGASTFGWSGSRLKNEPAVLVVRSRSRIDDARPEAHVVRLDQADRRCRRRRRPPSQIVPAATGHRGGRRQARPARIDPRRELRGVLRREQPLDGAT